MTSEIQLFIDEIARNLGLEATVYSQSGMRVCGEDEEICETNFNQVYFDTQKNYTLFRLRFKGKGYIIRIPGVGTVTTNYAYLINQLSQKSADKSVSITKEEFVLSVLHGEADEFQINKYAKTFSLLDNAKSCVIFIVNDDGKAKEIIEIINNYSMGKYDFAVELNEFQVALIKVFEDEEEDYTSFKEYAEFLCQFILEEMGTKTHVSLGSSVNRIIDLSTSLAQARYAHIKKDLVNLGGKVHSYKDYVLIKILEDVPKAKLREYLNVLLDSSVKEIFESKEMMDTAEEFLENSLNVSETSRKLFLHRNTLTYRLDKIQSATGLDIRKFSDALTFRLISILAKQVN
ncbi:MAG: helix-turn-helix domain-containing protein [Clostridia bacterium]|nr:helix-turn-helix domain-containing protein [Clostridia bacterium]